MITPLSNTSVDLLLDDRWVMEFMVQEDDLDYPASPVITVTATDPSGNTSTPTAELVSTGFYRVALQVDEAGRWIVSVVATGLGSTAFAAYVQDVTDADAFPDLAAVKSYLNGSGGQTTSIPDSTIQDALDAEAQAQRDVCNVPAIYTPALAQALKRRVARNLAMRRLPVAVLQGDSERGSLTPPGRDPEVRRLEGRYRKLVFPC